MKFPTTLDRIAPSGSFHVYAEYRGLRYYIGSRHYAHDARTLAGVIHDKYPQACAYIADKTGSTSINGTRNHLARRYA